MQFVKAKYMKGMCEMMTQEMSEGAVKLINELCTNSNCCVRARSGHAVINKT